MIDVSQITGELLSTLAGSYVHAAFMFGVDPLEASKAKQRKIRKWISNQYIGVAHELPEEAAVFSIENSDREVLSLLKACLDLEKSLTKKKEDKFDVDFAAMDEATKSALKTLLQSDFWPETEMVGNDIKIIAEDTPAYRRVLTLKNADAVPVDKEGYPCRNLGLVLKKEENRFCFYGELEDPVEETAEIFALTFDDADVEVTVYHVCHNMAFWESPWLFLRTLSLNISTKADLPGEYCNAKEKALLPLIKDIASLAYWEDFPEQEFLSFCELKKSVHQYGYHKAERLLDKLEAIPIGNYAFYKTIDKLIAVLDQKPYEPLWREIYNKISDSQVGYPHKVDSLCDKELLANVRSDIQALMESKGYIGTYPDFVKDGTLDGIHLEHSHNMTYFVGMEKHVQYHIHCCEVLEKEEYLTIQFLCGTALLKKCEAETDVDIYDCLFNANGRRLFHTMSHYIPLKPTDSTKADDLKTDITIAVKKAECIKLTKEEQKEYYGAMIPGWGMFWTTFLIAGCMFSIAMMLVVLLVCVVTATVFGLFSDIPEMLKIMPWGLLLAIGWIGFGGAMGLVEVLAHRK